MQIARWSAAGLFILAVPLILVLTNVRIAATEPRVYEYSFSQYDAVERSGIDRAQLDRAAREIVRYFRDDTEFLTTRVTIEGEEQPLFTTREVLHMRDVKDLFQWTFRLHEIAIVYAVVYVVSVFLWSRERQLRHLARQSVIGGVATVGILGVAALGVVVDFDELFRQFHLLSFSNDLWQLNAREHHLIQMFPQGFWFDVTLGVGVLSAMQGGLIALGAYAYLAWDRRRLRGPAPEGGIAGAATATLDDEGAAVRAAAVSPEPVELGGPVEPVEPVELGETLDLGDPRDLGATHGALPASDPITASASGGTEAHSAQTADEQQAAAEDELGSPIPNPGNGHDTTTSEPANPEPVAPQSVVPPSVRPPEAASEPPTWRGLPTPPASESTDRTSADEEQAGG